MRQIKTIYPPNNSRADLIQELWSRADFKKEVADIRRKWNIDVSLELHMWEENEHSIFQDELLDNIKFTADLKKLQRKFKLGEQWSSFIEEYIFIDSFIYQKTSNFFIEKRTGREGDSITGEPAYYLRIFPETTQEDIIKSWGEVNEFIHESKTKPKRQKLSKTFERNKKIYELAQSGYWVEDIQYFFKKKYGKSIEYNAIKTAEGRYRKKMGIKGSSKLKYGEKGTSLINRRNLELDIMYPDSD